MHHQVAEPESEIVARAVHARGTSSCGPGCALARVGNRRCNRGTRYFTMTMPFVIILSRASESSAEAICRPCGVIVPASRLASRSRSPIIALSPCIRHPNRRRFGLISIGKAQPTNRTFYLLQKAEQLLRTVRECACSLFLGWELTSLSGNNLLAPPQSSGIEFYY